MPTFTLPTTYTFTATGVLFDERFVFTPTNFSHKVVSKFNHQNFWTAFVNKHKPTNINELYKLIFDIARCHFSPKQENWPGVDIAFTYIETAGSAPGVTPVVAEVSQTININLPQGVSVVQNFEKGKIGGTWTWTHACLACASLHHEIFRLTAPAECAKIPGNYDGYTQMCGTLNGWTEADQTQAETAFSNWVVAQGLSARDAKVDVKIKAAAKATIVNRIASGDVMEGALSFKNILLLLTNQPMNARHQITK